MKAMEFVGTLIKDPDYLEGVSGNGFGWSKISLVIEEDGSDFVYCFGKFGNKAKVINDMGLVVGDKVRVIYLIECRAGSGEYEGKYFTSLVIESVEYLGKNDGIDGIMEGGKEVSGVGVKVDEVYMGEDPFGWTFDSGSDSGDMDIPF